MPIWIKVVVTMAALYGLFAAVVFALERGDVDWVAFHKALAMTLVTFAVMAVVVLGLCAMWHRS